MGPRRQGNDVGANPARVLVIDDEEPLRVLFDVALAQAGYRVLTAGTGRAGLEIAFREQPEVVLLDRHLPDISGQEVLDGLRADARTSGAVILLVSGDGQLERKLEGLGGGANDYLTKPVDLRELVARIEGHLTARDRWLGRLDEAMSTRMRLARTLVGLDASMPLPALLMALQREIESALGVADLAVSLISADGLVPPVDGHGREGATTIARHAARAVEAPWLERDVGRSVVHVPLETADAPFGVLSVVPHLEPEPVLSTLVDLAPQLSALLMPAAEAAVSTAGDRDRLTRLLAPDGMAPVFQPVVGLPGGEVVGYEGLTRFVDGTRPDLGFALAARHGFGAQFELEAARRILDAAEQLPADAWLSLNVSAATLLTSDLVPLVEGQARRLVLEITEHELVTDYAAVIDAVARLGVGLGVDDAGSGYASLRHVYELRPSMVKLDRAWVADIDRDPVRQALIGGLLRFTWATGASLVGEGIEREEERDVLAGLGVPLGQGYLFGRPAPVKGAPLAFGAT